ncbi:WD40 repeat domain-containing protein, partial [Nodosilinea sp. LEGE 07298]|uniref:WD40 repeat domain-containing protein n=1 Tax=Nodosilinea sp. LEGE 07298 TaxID=2777970 RepID=UPI00188196F8
YQRLLASAQASESEPESEPDPVLADDSPDQADLLLSGLVSRSQGQLGVKNAIYRTVFNPTWVAEQLAALRPYSQMLNAWLASDRQDESRLLRGQALHSAQQWAQGKRLTTEDFEYLAASEALDRQLIEDALKLAMAQEAEAKLQQEQQIGRLQKRLLRVLSLALLITAGSGALAFWQFRRAVVAQGQAQQETIRALASSSQARFTSNQRLAALIDAIQAEAGRRRLPACPPTPADVAIDSSFALRQAVYGADERNQLLSHTDNVNGVAFSPDGQRLASVSADTTLKIWQADGQLLHTVDASDTELYAVAYDPKNEQIAVAGGGGHVSLWTVEGEPLHSLNGHQVAVWSVTYSAEGDFLLTASQDGTVNRWSREGQLLTTVTAHNAPIYGVAISADGQRWATASTDGTAKVWDAQGQLLTTLTGHQGPVWAIDFAPDGRWLVTAGDDQTLKIWQPDGTLLHTLAGHDGPIWGVRVSPSGDFLASTSVDRTAKLWRPNGTLLKTLQGHTGNTW